MSAKFEYHVEHELHINHEKIIGEVTILELISHRRQILSSDGYNDTYNIIIDISEAIFTDFIENISTLTNFVGEVSKFRNIQRKCAVITSKPSDVVYAELTKISLLKMNSNIKIGIFSTDSAALNWLK